MPNEYKQTIADMVKSTRFCMMTYVAQSGNLHACPMTTQAQDDDGTIWFLGSRSSDTVEAIGHDDRVNVSFSQPGSQDFVSLNGRALLVHDEAKVDALWSDMYKTFFPQGRQDPDIQLICFAPVGGQYWKGEGKISTLFKLTKAAVGGGAPTSLGESHAVSYAQPDILR
ncbi:MAG: pyridoxamine 5'-phosphate oxidase family protein [Pseudomonadota bacterium]|nr:pyridoxamine 5'-phosphate oxidase family protein [Pseudomonadota bacterium]